MTAPFEVLISSALGLFAGALSGFLGIGGGAILAPLLVFALGIDQHRAQGISLAALLPPVGLPAVLAYRRRGVIVSVALVSVLTLGFVFGALSGAWCAHRVPGQALQRLFAIFLAVAAVRVLVGAAAPPAIEPRKQRPVWIGLPIGLLAGLMSGLLGVGGGIVTVPLLRRFANHDRLEAQATTLAMMLPPIGLPAVYVYAREQGGLPYHLLAAVAGGFLLGAPIGASAAGKASSRAANISYAVMLVALAIALTARA